MLERRRKQLTHTVHTVIAIGVLGFLGAACAPEPQPSSFQSTFIFEDVCTPTKQHFLKIHNTAARAFRITITNRAGAKQILYIPAGNAITSSTPRADMAEWFSVGIYDGDELDTTTVGKELLILPLSPAHIKPCIPPTPVGHLES